MIKKPNTRNYAKNTDSKKRKPEEDLETPPPQKRPKSNRDAKSGRRQVLPEEPVSVNNPNSTRK